MRSRLGGTVAALAVLLLAFALPAAGDSRRAHDAANGISFVLWSGGVAPGSSEGVLLRPDGTGQRLSANGGRVRVVGKFNPTGARLAAIRAAAKTATGAPRFINRPGFLDGGYVAATFDNGGRRDAAIAINAASPKLDKLIAAVDAALPSGQDLASTARVAAAHAAALRDTAPCAQGEEASAAYKDISLKDATRAKLVTLTGKGGFDTDAVAIDANWKRVPGPIHFRMNVEVSTPPGKEFLAGDFKQRVEKYLSGYKLGTGSEAGTPVLFEVNVHNRSASAPPTPCFHQLTINTTPKFRARGNHAGPEPSAIEVSTTDKQAWPHEAMHFAGLPDRYDDVFQVGNRQYPLPEKGLEGKALADALAQFGVKPSQGQVTSRPDPAAVRARDIMAIGTAAGGARVVPKDLRNLAGRYFIRITGVRGTVLGNKSGTEQNLVAENVNGPRRNELLVPPGGKAHADGIFGYCIDLTKHTPQRGQGYDIVGSFDDQGDPASQALARVMAVIERRSQAGTNLFGIVPGAQSAIWHITDPDAALDLSEAARSILVEAGVDPNQKFAYQHVNDPNAASPDTGAFDASGAPLPPFETLPQGADPAPPGARLSRVRVARRVGRRVRLLVVRIDLANAGADVRLTLLRKRGRRASTVRRFGLRTADQGGTSLLLALPRLRPGTYVLAVQLGRSVKRVALTVTR